MIRIKMSIVVALLFAASSAEAQLYFSRDDNSQLYRLDTTTAAATFVGTTGTFSNTVGLTESNDPNILYGSTWTDLSRINISAGTHTIVGSISGGAEGFAWDPTTSKLYGYINHDFFTLNPATAARTATLAGTPAEVEGIAWRNGFIYGLGGSNSNLYRYSIAGNSWSVVGDTGLAGADFTGLAYDPANDVLYAKNAGIGNLYRINPTNAAATLIGNTGIPEGGGLAFVHVIPEPSALCLGWVAALPIGAVRRRRRFR
jgi:hypothetical protein